MDIDIMSAFKTVTEQIKNWADDKLSNKVDKSGNKQLTDQNYSLAEKTKVSNMATGLAVLDGKLYLKNDAGIIENTATTLPSGSGGGGSSSASITLVNLLESNEITVAYGSSANLIFEYASSETDSPATAYIYLAGTLKKTYSINPGENTLDIGDIIGDGVNDIKLTVSDIYSNSKSMSFVINAISLKITSTFDDSQIFDGDVTIKYIPTGAISKEVHMILDGTDRVIETTSETGKQRTYLISGEELYHGVHDIVLYLSAKVGNDEIKSNKLYFSIIAEDSGVTEPVISSVCTAKTITQGEQLQISYFVYDPVSMETEISLVVYQNGEVYSEATRTVNATKQVWATRDLPVGEVELKIIYGVIERSHTITVVENNIDVSVKETDIEFQLKAAGKSNSDNDRDVWTDGDVTTTFEYVNWESTGWVNDENGDTALRLSGDAKATINFMPFKSDARQTGRTIEMEFAIRDVNNRDAVAISCISDGIGFTVTADTATMFSEQSEINCKYTDEKKVLVSFVIEPRTEYRLMYVFLNGVLSGVKQYVDNDNLQQTVPVNITVGSPYCSIDLYSIRSYDTALTKEEVRDNYIASIQDVGEQLAVFEDNNIYDDYGYLSFSKLQSRIPSLIIIGDLPTYKGDKKKVTIIYYDPQNPSLCFEATATIDVQGTSSQWYVVKNFKTKTSDAHQLALDQIATKVFTFKADYAEATSTHNTGTANYVHTLYNTPVPPQEVDERVRTTIYGHPAVIFHKKDSSSDLVFVGRYICPR